MNKTTNGEDINLLTQIQLGDEGAIHKLMIKYYAGLLNYGLRFTSDRELIKDCIQEIFIGLWVKKETATEILSPKFYFLRALKNKILKEFTRASKVVSFANYDDTYTFSIEMPVDEFVSVTNFTQSKAKTISDALQTLSNRQKEVFYLKYVQMLDNEQISSILNLNRQSVYNLMHQIITRLRTAIKPFLMTQ